MYFFFMLLLKKMICAEIIDIDLFQYSPGHQVGIGIIWVYVLAPEQDTLSRSFPWLSSHIVHDLTPQQVTPSVFLDHGKV